MLVAERKGRKSYTEDAEVGAERSRRINAVEVNVEILRVPKRVATLGMTS
jgi:hypothetical protein